MLKAANSFPGVRELAMPRRRPRNWTSRDSTRAHMQADTKFVILEIENYHLGKNDPIDEMKSLIAKLSRQLSCFISIVHILFIQAFNF